MKKNFTAIAALLIAAMLLVVSCSQEVAPKAEVDNGLVEVTLGVGYGRDLQVDGTSTNSVAYKYTLKANWNVTNDNAAPLGTEAIHGAAVDKPFGDGASIGYVTPGLWNVTVDAYESESADARKIFSGSSDVYFSKQNTSATVYLSPVTDDSNNTNKVTFEIKMQDMVGSAGVDGDKGSFEIRYKLTDVAGNTIDLDPATDKTDDEKALTPGASVKNVTTYTGDTTGITLKSGYYRVTVSVYSKLMDSTDATLVGGITKGFLLAGNDVATVKGNIEPSDYDKVTIDAFFINVKTTLEMVGNIEYTAGSAKVTVKLKNESTGNTSNLTPTYIWESATGTADSANANNKDTASFTFSAPGYKNISCQTIYKKTVGSTDYYFAGTADVQVYVDPANFVDPSTT